MTDSIQTPSPGEVMNLTGSAGPSRARRIPVARLGCPAVEVMRCRVSTPSTSSHTAGLFESTRPVSVIVDAGASVTVGEEGVCAAAWQAMPRTAVIASVRNLPNVLCGDRRVYPASDNRGWIEVIDEGTEQALRRLAS